MGKDPAVLFYIDSWLVSTAEMEADCRGWYLNLLLHNYDKGSLPNDIEKLAVLCNVRFSEFERFEHVFEQVLKHKFKLNDEQRLENPKTSEILQKRNDFKESRSNAGKTSYLMRFFSKKYSKEFKNQSLKNFIKENLDLSIDTKNEHMIEHMFEHLFELYININKDKNKDIIINENKEKECNNDEKNESAKKQPKERLKKVFLKPTLSEVIEYCNQRKNAVSAQKFIDYYESNGWKVGKNPMKDWKAAVRTWEQNSFNNGQAQSLSGVSPSTDASKYGPEKWDQLAKELFGA